MVQSTNHLPCNVLQKTNHNIGRVGKNYQAIATTLDISEIT